MNEIRVDTHHVLCEVGIELLFLHNIDERRYWGDKSPTPHRCGLVLNPGQSRWDLWWTLGHWDMFFFEFLGFVMSLLFHSSCVLTFIFNFIFKIIFNRADGRRLRDLLTKVLFSKSGSTNKEECFSVISLQKVKKRNPSVVFSML